MLEHRRERRPIGKRRLRSISAPGQAHQREGGNGVIQLAGAERNTDAR